jgi:hypothetical protein
LGVVCNRPTTNWARGWQCAAAPSAHVAAPRIMPRKGSSVARQSAGKKNYELRKVLEVSEQSPRRRRPTADGSANKENMGVVRLLSYTLQQRSSTAEVSGCPTWGGVCVANLEVV